MVNRSPGWCLHRFASFPDVGDSVGVSPAADIVGGVPVESDEVGVISGDELTALWRLWVEVMRRREPLDDTKKKKGMFVGRPTIDVGKTTKRR